MSEDNKIASQIEDLILQADNPKDKAFLLILNKIANNLDENTNLTKALSADLKLHRDEFAKHEKDEMALINQGRGFLRAAVLGLAAIQAGALWYGNIVLKDFSQVQSDVIDLKQVMAIHTQHHADEEKWIKDGMRPSKVVR